MAKQFCGFFCKTIYSFKKGNKNTQTNHYTLLTNASIKRCIKPGSEPCSSGGKSSSQTSTLQTITRVIQVMSILYWMLFSYKVVFGFAILFKSFEVLCKKKQFCVISTCSQSYKHFAVICYDSRAVMSRNL